MTNALQATGGAARSRVSRGYPQSSPRQRRITRSSSPAQPGWAQVSLDKCGNHCRERCFFGCRRVSTGHCSNSERHQPGHGRRGARGLLPSLSTEPRTVNGDRLPCCPAGLRHRWITARLKDLIGKRPFRRKPRRCCRCEIVQTVTHRNMHSSGGQPRRTRRAAIRQPAEGRCWVSSAAAQERAVQQAHAPRVRRHRPACRYPHPAR